VKDVDQLRPAAEKDAARKNCPVERLKQLLEKQKLLTDDDYQRMVREVRSRITEAEKAGAKPLLHDAGADPSRTFWPYAEGAGR
jgi:TPP-dependent pyruvate/acetoin dehydrogenase alpha subunit